MGLSGLVCVYSEACPAKQGVIYSWDAHTWSTCSVWFSRWQSSNGYCLSDEVIYGIAPIFRTGGVLVDGKKAHQMC